jgi:hypothetical protein
MDPTSASSKRKAEASASFRGAREVEVTQLHVDHLIYSVDNFFTAEECATFVRFAEDQGFAATDSPKTRDYAQRKQGRQQSDNPQLATALFERVKDVAPGDTRDGLAPVACNSNIRIYKYQTGDVFGKHYDEANLTSHGKTRFTMLVYLGSLDVVGGETVFHANPHGGKKKSKGKQKEPAPLFAVQPLQGRLLLHEHGERCLMHEAAPVMAGVKYVLRSDVIYK